MQITVFLLVISAIISIGIYIFSKKLFKSVVVFSVLANLAFLVNIGSRMFVFYHIKFLLYFSSLIWPLINIFLIIKYLKSKKKNEIS
ncbi:hypothetical protein BMS3Abin15_00675 [bacterium BMS3Abin15]|nr:hypothetical protein BMS3Abin15_00675 [bacterium BMS3Abin15]